MTRLSIGTSVSAVLFSLSLVLAGAPSAAAKEYDIRGQNRATYAAQCKPNPSCINWGGGVFTTGDTKVICTKTKCTMYEDDAPARQVPITVPTQDAPGTLH